MDSCIRFFFPRRYNRGPGRGILLLGFETVNVIFDYRDLVSIFDTMQDKHVIVVIEADCSCCSTIGVHNNLVEGLVRDETLDRSLEFIEIREYGFVSSTIAFAKANTSEPMDLRGRD